KDVLIGPEKITIRHRIPARASASRITQRDPQPDSEGDNRPSCQVRWGHGDTPQRSRMAPGELEDLPEPAPPRSSNPKLRGLQVGISCLTRHASLPTAHRCSQESLACRQCLSAACCYDALILDQPTAMHVVRIRSSHTDRQGRERQYESR